MDRNRGLIVVGASVAALVAGFFLRRWYVEKAAAEETESTNLVKKFDQTMSKSNAGPKKARRTTSNGRPKTATKSS